MYSNNPCNTVIGCGDTVREWQKCHNKRFVTISDFSATTLTTYLLAATVGDRSAWTVWYLGEEAISAATAAPTDTGEGGSAPGTMASLGLFFGVAIGEDACLREERDIQLIFCDNHHKSSMYLENPINVKDFLDKKMSYLAMALASLGVDVDLASFGGLAFCPLLRF